MVPEVGGSNPLSHPFSFLGGANAGWLVQSLALPSDGHGLRLRVANMSIICRPLVPWLSGPCSVVVRYSLGMVGCRTGGEPPITLVGYSVVKEQDELTYRDSEKLQIKLCHL